MRPKTLEIEGLQSFKTTQTIDFEHLGESGLFGIFGPTGSGKSTILDAITFALYGKVKRAERGTQGIINMNCNIARVAFTFELLKEGQRKKYRVERAYQRKKGSPQICEPKVVRLIEISQVGDIPLCDKATEVSNQVEALLGLNHEDFTRAVVLPQNSFQEFLMLDNTKKRVMLERIFYLEEYGKRLFDKILRKMSLLKTERDQLFGKLSGYEDATKEALAGARVEMKQAKEARKLLEDQLKQLTEEYQRTEVIWQLTQEMTRIQGREAVLDKVKLQMTQKRTQLELGLKAAGLGNRLAQVKWYGDKLAETKAALRQAQAKMPFAEDSLNQVKTDLCQLRADSTVQQPGLVERKTRLTEGLTLAKESATLNERLQKIRQTWTQQHEAIVAKKKIIATNEAMLSKGAIELAQLEQSLQGAQVSPSYRQALQQGLQWENQLGTLKKQAAEVGAMEQTLASKQKALLAQQAKVKLELTKVEATQSALQINIKHDETAIQANAAYSLALTLQDQTPCPVCGAQHHPQPAIGKGTMLPLQQELELAQSKEALLEATALYQGLEKELLQIDAELGWLQKSQHEQRGKGQELAYEMTQITEALQKFVNQNVELDNMRIKVAWEQLAKKDQVAWDLQKKLTQLQQRQAKLSVDSQAERLALQPLEETLIISNTEGSSLAEQKAEVDAKLSLLTGGGDIQTEIQVIEQQLTKFNDLDKVYQEKQAALQTAYDQLANQLSASQNREKLYQESWQKEGQSLQQEFTDLGFASLVAVEAAKLSEEVQVALSEALIAYDQEISQLSLEKRLTSEKLGNEQVSCQQWQQIEADYKALIKARDASFARSETAKSHFAVIEDRHKMWQSIQATYQEVAQQYESHDQIQKLLKGDRSKDNSFIDYIAEDRLRYVALKASETLGLMTQYKYGLELDIQMGFMIRDNANGGIHRSVSSLSGGEVFLTSLALALALSEQIQLKGQSPLEFFFLDEGFGTLDSDLLDIVMDALEGLSSPSRMIGLISHVPEMRCRMARRLIVEPPSLKGEGSQVRVEKA